MFGKDIKWREKLLCLVKRSVRKKIEVANEPNQTKPKTKIQTNQKPNQTTKNKNTQQTNSMKQTPSPEVNMSSANQTARIYCNPKVHYRI
jgi:hypothetical protein